MAVLFNGGPWGSGQLWAGEQHADAGRLVGSSATRCLYNPGGLWLPAVQPCQVGVDFGRRRYQAAVRPGSENIRLST